MRSIRTIRTLKVNTSFQNSTISQEYNMNHQAAWIKEPHAALVVDEAPMPTPGPGEMLVRVKVIGFSPLEAKIQK